MDLVNCNDKAKNAWRCRNSKTVDQVTPRIGGHTRKPRRKAKLLCFRKETQWLLLPKDWVKVEQFQRGQESISESSFGKMGLKRMDEKEMGVVLERENQKDKK